MTQEYLLLLIFFSLHFLFFLQGWCMSTINWWNRLLQNQKSKERELFYIFWKIEHLLKTIKLSECLIFQWKYYILILKKFDTWTGDSVQFYDNDLKKLSFYCVLCNKFTLIIMSWRVLWVFFRSIIATNCIWTGDVQVFYRTIAEYKNAAFMQI